MRIYYALIILLVALMVLVGCGEDSEEQIVGGEKGSIQGKITDKELGNPVEGVTVFAGSQSATTDRDGNYVLNDVSYSDNVDIAAEAKNYKEYKTIVSLRQKLLTFDISLEVKRGDIHGKVTDKELGNPIGGAAVAIGGQTSVTDKDGSYALEGVRFSDKTEIVVSAGSYLEYKTTTSLDRELLIFNISLVPAQSPSAAILEILKGLSEDIEALDPNRLPSIQARISEDYVAADDEATAFGIFAGVIPPDYKSLPDTILTIVEKYTKLEFNFVDPDVKISGNSASVDMRFEVYAETKRKVDPPEPPKKWEIVVNGNLELQKYDGVWKITKWQLIPPFLKFEWKPL